MTTLGQDILGNIKEEKSDYVMSHRDLTFYLEIEAINQEIKKIKEKGATLSKTGSEVFSDKLTLKQKLKEVQQ